MRLTKLEIKDGLSMSSVSHALKKSKRNREGLKETFEETVLKPQLNFKNLNHFILIKPVKGAGRAPFSRFVVKKFLLGLKGQP